MNRRYSRSMSLRNASAGGEPPKKGSPNPRKRRRLFNRTRIVGGVFAVLVSTLFLVMALGAVTNSWNATTQRGVFSLANEGRVHARLIGVRRVNSGSERLGPAFDFPNQTFSRILLQRPVRIGAEWTISAWFLGPLRPNGRWHTLTRGLRTDHQIIVHPGGWLGSYLNRQRGFKNSGYNIFRDRRLRSGWHQITAVGSRGRTTFYIDGRRVGRTVFGQSRSDVFAIGNYQGGYQRFARRIDDIQIDNRALNPREVFTLFRGEQTAETKKGQQKAAITQSNAQLVDSITKLEAQLGTINQRLDVIEKWGTSLKISAK